MRAIQIDSVNIEDDCISAHPIFVWLTEVRPDFGHHLLATAENFTRFGSSQLALEPLADGRNNTN